MNPIRKTKSVKNLQVHVHQTTEQELLQIIDWLQDPAIYSEAFWLPAEPDAAWIRRSCLLVLNGQGLEFQPVRIWSVEHQNLLIGLAIDYGWNHANDSTREIDFALPASPKNHVRLPLYTLAGLIHALFSNHNVMKILGRMPAGPNGKGFPRLYKAVGGTLEYVREDAHPLTGKKVLRACYGGIKKDFYATQLGQSMQLANKQNRPVVKNSSQSPSDN